MKFFNSIFSRFTALVILVVFTYVSCDLFSSPDVSWPDPVVITPGEGTPRYVYLDTSGNIIENDTYGRTLLYVEENKNAEGVLIVADKFSSEDRVIVHNQNNNSTVSMFFEQGSNFPYLMIIKRDAEVYYAYLSYYKTASSTYDIMFEKDGEISQMTDLVLNKNIFTVYQNDSALNQSQNLRLRNITIALGLWGSLYNAFDEPDSVFLRANWFKSFVSGVKEVFRVVAVIATVVAVVVAPVVAFINPGLETAIYLAAFTVAIISDVIVIGLTMLEEILYDEDLEPPLDRSPIRAVNVKYQGEYIKNGVVIHIDKGKEVVLEFTTPGHSYAVLKSVYTANSVYEPGNSYYPIPSTFEYLNIHFVKESLPPDRFNIRIERKNIDGFAADGKTSFGFTFGNGEEIHINNSVQPLEHKFWGGELKTYKNLVVVWFCLVPNCPDDSHR
jgi:hypothetical protein